MTVNHSFWNKSAKHCQPTTGRHAINFVYKAVSSAFVAVTKWKRKALLSTDAGWRSEGAGAEEEMEKCLLQNVLHCKCVSSAVLMQIAELAFVPSALFPLLACFTWLKLQSYVRSPCPLLDVEKRARRHKIKKARRWVDNETANEVYAGKLRTEEKRNFLGGRQWGTASGPRWWGALWRQRPCLLSNSPQLNHNLRTKTTTHMVWYSNPLITNSLVTDISYNRLL